MASGAETASCFRCFPTAFAGLFSSASAVANCDSFLDPGTPWPPTSHGEKPTQLQAMEVIDFFWPSSGHLDCHDQSNDFTIILLAWSLIISTGYGEDHGRTLYDQCFYYYCRGFQLSQSLFNLKMADKNWRQHNFKTFTLKLKSEQKTCLKKTSKTSLFSLASIFPKTSNESLLRKIFTMNFSESFRINNLVLLIRNGHKWSSFLFH